MFKGRLLKVSVAIVCLGIIMMIIVMAAVIAAVLGGGSKAKSMDLSAAMDGLPPIITQEMLVGAVTSQEKYGVPAALTLAQIILESGGSYEGGLSQLAFECKNLFGVKGEGPAGSKVYKTAEYTASGSKYYIDAKFRKYNSFLESIDDHGKLLSSSFYRVHTVGATSTDEFAKGIHKAGYATSPDYADMLITIMKQYNLYRFDGMSISALRTSFLGSGTASGSFAWPTMGKGVITSRFGPRYAPTGGASTFHQGIDIAGPSGTQILAADGGTVIFTGWYGGGGNSIKIDHGGGTITEYLHLRAGDGIMVSVGQKVTKGQQIGRMGTTGTSTGNHLHFGVSVGGQFVDPLLHVKQPN